MKTLLEHTSISEDLSGCCLNCQKSFQVIRSRVLDFHSELSDRAQSPEELCSIYRDLDDLAHLEVSSHLADHILEDPMIQQVLPKIRSYYTTFFDHHEAYLAKRILESDDPWSVLSDFPLSPRYKALIKSQVEALNLSPEDVLAFVGCGPLPISLILLSRLYGIRSLGLDVNPLAVYLAKNCVRKLGLEREISIIEGDETALSRLSWDAVLVAALAEPKSRIFRNLITTLRDKGPQPVCYRTYTGMRAVLYHPVQPEDISGFRKVKEIAPQGRVNNTLVVLEMQD